jgi:hypothetical protein
MTPDQVKAWQALMRDLFHKIRREPSQFVKRADGRPLTRADHESIVQHCWPEKRDDNDSVD